MEGSSLVSASAATHAADETPAASQAPPVTAQDPPPPPQTAYETSPAPPAAAQAPPPPSAPVQAPPPPSSTGTLDPPTRGKKRPLDGNFRIENSNYFKMRLILKDLRPHFIEVLRTPDFKNCKAANEIREKMKLMLELYQQMIGHEDAIKSQSLPNGNGIEQTPQNTSERSSETWSFQAGSASEKHQSEGGDKRGSHVVGGSAFGWNFITYGGSEPVYYGMTKEEYRSSHPITETLAEA